MGYYKSVDNMNLFDQSVLLHRPFLFVGTVRAIYIVFGSDSSKSTMLPKPYLANMAAPVVIGLGARQNSKKYGI